MNSVKLTGVFAKVSAYTDGDVKVEYSQDWKSYFKDDFNQRNFCYRRKSCFC